MEHRESLLSAMVVCGVVVFVLAAYSVRAAFAGRLSHARLTRLGSPLLGRWAVEAFYWSVQAPSRVCVRLGIGADALSWASLALALATLPLIAYGRLALAGGIFALGAVLDVLDGLVARQTGTASNAGELLDAVIDRYADAAPLIGLAIFYRASPLAMAVPLAALIGTLMVSYNRAKAESLHLDLSGGAMRRHERIFYLCAALVIGPMLPVPAWALQNASSDLWVLAFVGFVAVLTNAEALRLARQARLALRQTDKTAATQGLMTHAAPAADYVAGSAGHQQAVSAPAPSPTTAPGDCLPHIVVPPPGPLSRALREREERHIAPGYQAIAAHAGIAVDHGRGSLLIDVDGNRFLDLAAGIGVAALGYAHPEYVQALAAQLSRTHVGSFTSASRVAALEALAQVAPAGLHRAQLYSGGSEAVESALRLARAYTGKNETLAFWGGFHGKTSGPLALMGSDFKHGLGPLMPGAYLTPYADCAFCPFRVTYPACGLLCVDFARDKIKRETTGRLAAIVVEPMQGTAGNIVPPADFLPAVAALAKEHGALLIVDEMITGFGRTGSMFAVLNSNVQPDIMTVGKALGGGFPVSAVLTNDDIAQAKPWSMPSFSSSSYGGNPLAGAAIAASLGIIRRHNLPANARRVGAVLREGLGEIARRHPCVQNLRGEGLFLGFDLVDEHGALWPAARCRTLFGDLVRRGLITMAYAPRVRINPPLVLTLEQAQEAITILERSFSELNQ